MTIDQSIDRFKGMNVLVTGATGFIGRNLITRLSISRDINLYCCGRSIELGFQSKATYMSLDLASRKEVEDMFRRLRIDFIFNLAACIDQSVDGSIYSRLVKANVDTLVNLIELAPKSALRGFVHVGTNAEYGNTPCPQKPSNGFQPNSAYGITKHAASCMVIAKAQSEGFPGVVVRPFYVYGDGESPRSLISQILKSAAVGKPFATTEGDQTRDFVHIDWVIEDLLSAALALRPGEQANLCTGQELSLKELLNIVKEVEPSFMPLLGKVPYRNQELMKSCGEPYRARTRSAVTNRLAAHFENGIVRARCV